jgi:hypothetical protein
MLPAVGIVWLLTSFTLIRLLFGVQSLGLRKGATLLAIDSPQDQGEMIGPMTTEMATNLNNGGQISTY